MIHSLRPQGEAGQPDESGRWQARIRRSANMALPYEQMYVTDPSGFNGRYAQVTKDAYGNFVDDRGQVVKPVG